MRIATFFVALSFLSACGGDLEIKKNSSDEVTIDDTTPGTDVASNCGVDELICGGRCTDTRSNASHCGGCGNICASGSCVDYECTTVEDNNGTAQNNGTGETTTNCNFELCNDLCTDTTDNPDHCGACNSPCTGGQVCQNNMCASLGEVEGILVASNQARASGADCGQYGQFAATTPLVLDPELNKAAQVHAKDMADNNFFSHTGSDGSNFSQRISRTAFSGQPVGENIAGGGSEPAGIVDRWIDSDGHCRNLMNPNATKLGVGYTVGGQYGTLWVQVFAR